MGLTNTTPKICDECSSSEVKKIFEEDTFIYGIGNKAVKLTVMLPVWRCPKCEFAYTDGEAEDIRDAEVKKHLNNIE